MALGIQAHLVLKDDFVAYKRISWYVLGLSTEGTETETSEMFSFQTESDTFWIML